MSFMTLPEKGIGGDTTVFTLVPSEANEGIMIVAVCLASPVEKGIHLVHYPLFADYLATHKWVSL